ncbi:MAG: response regulator [Nitrospirae bacterium]|nr:response regulator [Nitrospirota bacterium]
MKVLVIDDDAAACGMLDEVLTRLGLQVRTSPDALAGLEAAKAIHPDLIFINLLLSDTNGLKVSKAIHAVRGLEKVPIIMLISHRGELDPKYTVTIGILDTLVKPLKEAEIMEKTKAVLGNLAVTERQDDTIREISLEEEMEPMLLHEEEVMTEETAHVSTLETVADPIKEEDAEQDERELSNEMTKEGELRMPEKENPFDKKEDDDRDLFTDESDVFGEELEKSRAENRGKLPREEHEEDSFPEDEVDLSYGEEKPAGSVRRILLIAASIVVGIALGVGGYFFFTAGKHAPVEKQIAKALPEPVPQPAPAAIPSDKPNVIPEIPVRTEPQKSDMAQAKEAKPSEPLPKTELKKESAQKAEAEKPKKEAVPVAAATVGKKTAAEKQPAGKGTRAAVKGKQAYYVQAGLFGNEANAIAMAEKLKEKGYTPSVKKIEDKDKKVIFRVTAGNYANFKKAVEVSETLSKQGIKAIVHKQ